MNFNYEIENLEKCKVIKIIGSLSVASIELFQKTLMRMVQETNIIVDLSSLEIVTSSGFNAIVDVILSAKDYSHRVFVLKPSDYVRDKINVLNAHDYFNIIDTVDEGVAKLKIYN